MKLEEHFAVLQERVAEQTHEDEGATKALPEIARRDRGNRPDNAVDVPPARLAHNALNTVGGAVALGVLAVVAGAAVLAAI